MTSRPFGTLSDGRSVEALTLRSGDLQAEVLSYGAILRSLRFQGVPTVLGFDTLAEYERDATYQGCIVGRFANRIGRARFEIDGQRYQVEANEGPNLLHGGHVGFGRRLWRVERADDASATLAYLSPDGEAGFPGAVETRVTFSLPAPDTLEIVWSATTDRPTAVNLTHHPYFNLSGDPARISILDHRLTIAADATTPVHPDLIPTGEIVPVDGTPFDFRGGARIGERLKAAHPQLAIAGGIDHNWVLTRGAAPALALLSPESGITLEIVTDQPGLQLYSGQGLGPPFVRYGGLVVEPQGFPDAPNQPAFPSAILRPGETYRRHARYRFLR